MRTLFKADWVDASFIHFAIDPQVLQPHVPLPLDLLDGKAIVSLVAFTQKRLRPAWGGRLAEFFSAPLAEHEFLNLRTYVCVNGEPAIFFLAEWIPNRLAQFIGPLTYGLPYRLAELRYQTKDPECVQADVRAKCGDFSFTGMVEDEVCDGLSGFLLERYAACTCRRGRVRRFEIKHAPWQARRLRCTKSNLDLIHRATRWFAAAVPLAAHFSRGVSDVHISPPTTIGYESNAFVGCVMKSF